MTVAEHQMNIFVLCDHVTDIVYVDLCSWVGSLDAEYLVLLL